MAPLIDSLTAKNLPNNDMRQLAEEIGLDAVKVLLDRCRGMSFYVPLKMPPAFCREYLKAHYNPDTNNVMPMARDLGITVRQVYRLLRHTPGGRGA
ncbi:MAG: Mor transcription activator family protein [Fibrobacteria bacterium]